MENQQSSAQVLPLNLPDIDPDTTLLLAKLALEDIEIVEERRKGKSRIDSPLSDEEYAFQLQSEELNTLLRFSEDRKIASSVASAIESDQAYLHAFAVLEEVAAEDRRAAIALQAGRVLPAPSRTQRLVDDPGFIVPQNTETREEGKAVAENFKERSTPKSVSFNVGMSYEEDNEPMELKASTQNVAGPSLGKNQKTRCTACGDQIKIVSSLRTPCNHDYCPDCVTSLVETLTHDESLYPLRCCKVPIPPEDVSPFIKPALLKLFHAKNVEFGTPVRDRLYCANRTCSAFIDTTTPPLPGLGSSWQFGKQTESIECQSCRSYTCRACKSTAHPGLACSTPDDIAKLDEQLRSLATQNKWQTCPQCHAVVELVIGCYHITCRCRYEFCYLCAEQWKKCRCEQWDEHRLVIDAERRVENNLGARARVAQPTVFRQRVQEHIERLRYNHGCDRHSWTKRNGGGQCEECHYYLPEFLLMCRHCHLMACVRCARNRL